MKKVLLSITLMILILSFDKVDALSLDGIHTGQLKVFNNAPTTEFGSACAGATTDNLQFTYLNFNTYIQNLDNDYAVFSFASSEQEYYDTTDSTGHSEFYTNRLTNKILKISLVSNNAAWGNCEFQSNQIVCPMQHLATYTALQIAYICPVAGGNEINYLTMFINDFVEFYKNDKQETTNAIESQTQQQQQQHDQFMNETQQYNDEQDPNIRGVNETQQFEQAESQLIESLDLNTSVIDEIVINPQASVFIWNIVEVLRSMNPAIIVLMSSMLGFGIMKLILNR